MSYYNFLSRARTGAQIPAFTQEQVKSEPMFFSSAPWYAMQHGGAITQAFFKAIGPLQARDYIFDSRVHMLMPGWYPCIPGYHHDDVPRSRSDGQPNYESPEYRSQHVMCLVNGSISSTKFALGEFKLPHVPEGLGAVYKHWHGLVEKSISDKAELTYSWDAPDRTLIYFDCDTFHQGTPAIGTGFRWFGRLSWNTERVVSNEIRRQTQVYLPEPMAGW